MSFRWLEDKGTVLVDLALCCDEVRLFDEPGLGEGGVGIFVKAFGGVLTERVGGFAWNVNSVEILFACQ